MFEFIANRIYVFWILVMLFLYLYLVGGDDIIFFRKKKYEVDPKSGEKLMNALAKFTRGRDYEVISAGTVEFEGNSFSFDALVLTHAGTVIVNAQPLMGEFYADLNNDQWTRLYKGDRTKIANPLPEMKNNEKVLRDMFRAENCKYGTSFSVVAFTNKNGNVVAARNIPACNVADLAKKLTDMKATADNGANISDMKAVIEKHIKK